MLREYDSVIPLVTNPNGWSVNQVQISHDPNPVFTKRQLIALKAAKQRTIQERTKFGDFNAPKAAVRRLRTSGENLIVETALTEYFVLWGLPGAQPELHYQALDDLKNRHATDIPMGISTHNIVFLAEDRLKPSENTSVIMIVNDPKHGFAPGRLSVSYEGQMDPTKDTDSNGIPSTHQTVLRTLKEEFGIGLDESKLTVDPNEIRLIAVCAEKGSAYTSWCHAIWIQATVQDLVNSYQLAPRRKDADSLLSVPIQEIATYTQNQIKPQEYHPYVITGSVEENTILKPHSTVPWRVDALKDFIDFHKKGR